MNTPEQKGTTLARDMIALVESHYTLNDERMIAMMGMLRAFDFIEDHLHLEVYADDPKTGIAIHDAFARVYYPYMRECIKNSSRLNEEAKERMLKANAEMLKVYFPEGIVL